MPDTHVTDRGIVDSRGLSPLRGALYLTPLHCCMNGLCEREGLVLYVRYKVDIVLLARTR